MCTADTYLENILTTPCDLSSPGLRIYSVEPDAPEGFASLKDGKSKLPSFLEEISDDNLDKRTAYYNDNLSSCEKMSRWASKRGSQFYVFNNSGIGVKNHICLIFSLLWSALDYPDILARNNLFHGHIMHHTSSDDILVVFHAFEYPSDLEPNKSNLALQIEPSVGEYTRENVPFNLRNAIYSYKYNNLYVLDHVNHGKYCPTLYTDGITLDEAQCGIYLYELNYFPREYENPFLG